MIITLSDFNSVEVEPKEFRKMVEELIEDMYPNSKVSQIDVHDYGILVILDSRERIEIEIDWNEFIIK